MLRCNPWTLVVKASLLRHMEELNEMGPDWTEQEDLQTAASHAGTCFLIHKPNR